MAMQHSSGNGERKPFKSGKVEKKRSRLTGTDADVLLVPKKPRTSKIGSEFPSSSAKPKRDSLTPASKLEIVRE